MENNFNYCGKNVLGRRKKNFQEDAAKYLREERERRAREEETLQEENYNTLLRNAGYGNAQYTRSRDRAKLLQESLNYREKTTKSVMTKYIMQIVENALLIDKEEYLKLNPKYIAETEKLITDFLDKADLNENITNENTLIIMEHISRNIPAVKTGVLLETSQIVDLVTDVPSNKVNMAMTDLSSDIESKVANIVSTTQTTQDAIQQDLDAIVALGEAAPKIKKSIDDKPEVPAEAIPPEAMPAEEIPADMPPEAVPAEGELPPEEMPVDQMPPEAMGAPAAPAKSVVIAPDGTLAVNIFEEVYDILEDEEIVNEDYIEKKMMSAYAPWKAHKAGKVGIGAYAGETVGANVGSALGFVGLLLGAAVGAGIGAAVGAGVSASQRRKIKESPEYQKLKKLVDEDEGCQKLIAQIKETKGSERKEYVKKFTAAVRRIMRENDLVARKKKLTETKIFIHEVPKQGLLETLAVNEGMKMIEEGKEYNGDLALANALNYITVLETMDTLGLVNIDEAQIRNIIRLGGGVVLEETQVKKKPGNLEDVVMAQRGSSDTTQLKKVSDLTFADHSRIAKNAYEHTPNANEVRTMQKNGIYNEYLAKKK